MQLVKITDESLSKVCSQDTVLKAENYIGTFYECEQNGNKISGKMKGNHGEYKVSLDVNGDEIHHNCVCKTSSEHFCKHAAALAYTYINSPWLFSGKRKKRTEVHNIDDVKYYIATTPLKEMFIELKGQGLSMSDVAGLLKVSVPQLSNVVRDDQAGKTHQLTEPIKLACTYLLEKKFTS